MACGCAKDQAGCATCRYGQVFSSPWVNCTKIDEPLQMIRGQITTFSDGTRRVRQDALCTEWSVRDASPTPVPA